MLCWGRSDVAVCVGLGAADGRPVRVSLPVCIMCGHNVPWHGSRVRLCGRRLSPSVPHCPVSVCAIRGKAPGPSVAGMIGRIAIHGYAGQGACQSIIPGTIHTEVSIIMLAWSGTYRPLYHTRSVHTTHPESSYRGVLYDAVRCSPAGHIYSMA